MHGSSIKYLIGGAVVVAAGMTLLLVDTSSGPKSNSTSPVQRKEVRNNPGTENYQSESFGGSGFSSSFDSDGTPGRAGRMDEPDSGPDVKTSDPAMGALQSKFESLRAVRKEVDRKKALLDFGRELARTDPAGGFALIKSMAAELHGFGHGGFMFGGSDAGLVCQGFFEVAAQANVSTALTMAMELPRELHRDGLGTVMKTWATSDLAAAVAYIDKLPADYARHGAESVFAVWGEKDPVAALNGALKFGDPSKPETGMMVRTAVMSAMDGWATLDPKAAWEYALKPDDAVKGAIAGDSRLFSMIAAKWASKDLDAAMAAVRAMNGISADTPIVYGESGSSSSQAYQRMVEFMTMSLFNTDPVAVGKLFDREKWLAGNPWLSSRNVTRLLGEGSVSEAADWMTKIPDKNTAFDLARQIASRKTKGDYDTVFKWAGMIQDDYVKAGALSNVAAVQAQYDINRPIEWIYDLPSGYSKDRSVAGYVLGRIRQTGDRELEYALRKQMALPQIDMAGIALTVAQSKVDPQDKIALMNLVEGRRPEKPLVIQ